MLVLELLTHAANDARSLVAPRVISPLDSFDDSEIRWVVEGGLGPLLFRAAGHDLDRVPAAWRETLLSADLTAQIRSGNLIDTAIEVIEACEETQTPVTLLKGISTSEQYYPVPHLRPMADIDIVIPPSAYASVESAILRRGYLPMPDYEVGEGAAHGVPLFHPDRRVWVEVHTALFPKSERQLCEAPFSAPRLPSQSVPSTFHGRPVNRFTAELQLAYIAASWWRDITVNRICPSFLASLFDAVYLVKASGQAMDWGGIPIWLDNEMATACLYAMFAFLSRHGLAPCALRTVSSLASRQRLVGPLQLQLMNSMLDSYLVRGRKWDLPFPPPVPGRYSVRNQLRKRLPTRRSAR